jgi:quercetin dioxygenase-like cupin family protein
MQGGTFMAHKYYADWQEKVVYAPGGPQPQVLEENARLKVVVAGLEPGQVIPEHPESMAVYHFLEGNGVMLVDGARVQVVAGSTVITPEGARRGVEAETRLAFLAARISG